MKSRNIISVLILLLTGLMMGCKRESPTTWQSDVLVPIANGRITLNNIIDDSLLYYDEECLWHLLFHESLTDFDLDTLVEIPDTVITKSFVVPIVGGPFVIAPGQEIIEQTENNLINVNDAQLREVRIKSGELQYSIRSYINGYLDCVYELPGVTLNGSGTTIQTVTQPGSGANPYVYNGILNLAGYKIDMTGESGFMFNRIFTHLILSAATDAPASTFVSGNDSLVIELKFVNPIVSYARGYFGQHNYELNEEVDFSDNVNFPDGNLNLQQATMKMQIVNSVGVDAQINFEEVSSYSNFHDLTLPLVHAPLYQPLNITRAYDNNGAVSSATYEYNMNNGNSNIVPFISNLPDVMNLQANVIINPLGNVTDGNDFIYTEKSLSATVDLDVPLNIGMQDLTLIDTIEINTDETELVANGAAILYFENAFPFTAKCSVWLIDDAGSSTTLLNYGQMQSAFTTDTQGVTIPAGSSFKVLLDQYVIDRINESHRFVVKVVFDTPDDGQTYGLYKDYYIDFKVVADGEVQLKYD